MSLIGSSSSSMSNLPRDFGWIALATQPLIRPESEKIKDKKVALLFIARFVHMRNNIVPEHNLKMRFDRHPDLVELPFNNQCYYKHFLERDFEAIQFPVVSMETIKNGNPSQISDSYASSSCIQRIS